MLKKRLRTWGNKGLGVYITSKEKEQNKLFEGGEVYIEKINNISSEKLEREDNEGNNLNKLEEENGRTNEDTKFHG